VIKSAALVPTARRLKDILRKEPPDVVLNQPPRSLSCIINNAKIKYSEYFEFAETVLMGDVSCNGSGQAVTDAKEHCTNKKDSHGS
jgi:hypothetical protein